MVTMVEHGYYRWFIMEGCYQWCKKHEIWTIEEWKSIHWSDNHVLHVFSQRQNLDMVTIWRTSTRVSYTHKEI